MFRYGRNFTPEIWERVAYNTGIEELGQTTRDIPSYEKLMDMRLQIMSEKGIMLSDVQEAAASLEFYQVLLILFRT